MQLRLRLIDQCIRFGSTGNRVLEAHAHTGPLCPLLGVQMTIPSLLSSYLLKIYYVLIWSWELDIQKSCPYEANSITNKIDFFMLGINRYYKEIK